MKEKLNKCVTWNDANEVFKTTDKGVIKEFIDALEKAKNFIDLTMRDEALLSYAILYIKHND